MVVHGSNEFIVTFRQSKGARMGEGCITPITSQTFKLYVVGRITLLQHTNHVQYVVY